MIVFYLIIHFLRQKKMERERKESNKLLKYFKKVEVLIAIKKLHTHRHAWSDS